jgi:hypothetical protein
VRKRGVVEEEINPSGKRLLRRSGMMEKRERR